MRLHLSISIPLLVILGFFGVASTSNAQLDITSLSPTSVTVNMVPQNPGPNKQVNISLESYSTNLNAANITWKINSKTEKSGRGVKTFSFTTGAMNTTTTVGITIETLDGEIIRKTLNVKPSSVDLIWQSLGYVPPFYKGKALFAYQNQIQFVAVPHLIGSGGQEIPSGNLLYKWTLNGKVLGGSSGYGMNTYSLVGPLISRPLEVEVEVSSLDSSITGYTRTVVSPIQPQIVMYEKSPLYGILFQKALLGTVGLNNSKEMTVVGVPFYFSAEKAKNLQYHWTLNGLVVDSGSDPTTKIFRQAEGSSGTSSIHLSVENGSKILQSASGGFNLTFGEDQQNTFLPF